MAWVQIQKSTEATWEDYQAIQGAIGDDPPPGLLYHAAGEAEGGRWQSVSVWESQDDFNRFLEERIMPAVAQTVPKFADGAPPPTEWFEAKHIVAV